MGGLFSLSNLLTMSSFQAFVAPCRRSTGVEVVGKSAWLRILDLMILINGRWRGQLDKFNFSRVMVVAQVSDQ